MAEIKIVKATREDFEGIKKLMLTALKDDPSGFSVSFEEYNNNSDFWWFSYIDPYLSSEKDSMYIAKIDGETVGMAGLMYDRKERKRHVAVIVWVYVAKGSRRKGIAKLLMAKIMEDTQTNEEIEKLSLFVNSTQEGALNLYKKLGFEVTGVLKKDMKIDGEYVDTFIMELFI